MDYGQFDDLTRSVAGDCGTRRAVLRLLAGGVVGGFVARLGLTETAETKAKKKRKQHKPGEQSQPTGGVQTEGKRNKRKNRDKNRDKKPKPKPPECYSNGACGPCQSCVNGTCMDLVPLCPGDCTKAVCNSETNSWECRSTCQLQDSICCQGQCLASPACGNTGKQLNMETCQCECPPGKKECPNDSCVPDYACCPGETSCGGGRCASAGQCCPGMKPCDNVGCIPDNSCCRFGPFPDCTGCTQMTCDNGDWLCVEKPGVDCGSGTCCPTHESGYSCREGKCCRHDPNTGWYICG
jgi:hypothetical protein